MIVGQISETRRTYNAADLRTFTALAGAEVAHVPEPLIGALISYMLGVYLPGPGTNYLKQDMTFYAAAPAGAELIASVEVTRLRPEKALVDLRAKCTLADGTMICEGRSLVKYSGRAA